MKLNLGCGKDYRVGYVNVDIRKDVGADTIWNLEDFPYPWGNNSIEDIFAKDVVEHITYHKQNQMLAEFYRILQPEGFLEIYCPDLEALWEHYYINRSNSGGGFGHPHAWMEHFIFGGQDYPDNTHRAGYTKELMKWRLEKAGFKIISMSAGMHVVAQK